MNFKEIKYPRLDKDQILWRYIDLHKLIDLLSNRRITFTRLDNFNDPNEGVSYNLIAQRYEVQKSKITNETLIRLLPDHEIKRIDTKKLIEEKIISRRQCQYVNCWIKSNRESIAMWNLYSNKDSIALKINAKILIGYFRSVIKKVSNLEPKAELICGSVRYFELNPFNPFAKPKLPYYSAFKKELAYDYEKEYRFLISFPIELLDIDKRYYFFKVEDYFLNSIELVCHPEMEEWKFKNIEELCKLYKIGKPKKSNIVLLK
jgi:hypothetical protein